MPNLTFKSQRNTFFLHQFAERLNRILNKHDNIPHSDRQSFALHLQFPEIQ